MDYRQEREAPSNLRVTVWIISININCNLLTSYAHSICDNIKRVIQLKHICKLLSLYLFCTYFKHVMPFRVY